MSCASTAVEPTVLCDESREALLFSIEAERDTGSFRLSAPSLDSIIFFCSLQGFKFAKCTLSPKDPTRKR